jgi:hypothetical protein
MASPPDLLPGHFGAWFNLDGRELQRSRWKRKVKEIRVELDNRLPLRHARSKPPDKPAASATRAQDVISRPQIHKRKHGPEDRKMALLHLFTASRLCPAVEFFTKLVRSIFFELQFKRKQ